MKDKKDIEKIDLESVVNTILNKGLDEGLNLYDRFKNS
jgi:RNA-directed DNA polymerase